MTKQLIEFVYYITPDGVEYPLFGGKRALMGWTGFGLPPLHYIKDRGPFQHGSTVRDFRLDDRLIELQPYEGGCDRDDYWTHQGDLLDAIRPNRGAANAAGRIFVILPDYTEREIFARILEGPSGNYDAGGSQLVSDLRELLRFEAADPVWRDPTQTAVIVAIVVGTACLPFCLPNCLGSSTINIIQTVTYAGTWQSFPTIEITGPLNGATVENLTTGEQIKLNYNISAGEVVTIQITQEMATVTNNFGANLIGTVENPSELSTFHIECAPRAAGGVNQIRFFGYGGIAGQTGITLSYYTNYLGVPR